MRTLTRTINKKKIQRKWRNEKVYVEKMVEEHLQKWEIIGDHRSDEYNFKNLYQKKVIHKKDDLQTKKSLKTLAFVLFLRNMQINI